MPITSKQTEHLANLARLKLTAGEKAKFSKEISSILDYVNQLNEVVETPRRPASPAGRGVSTTEQPTWREDKAEAAAPETVKQIMENAPEKEERLFKVKAVFE